MSIKHCAEISDNDNPSYGVIVIGLGGATQCLKPSYPILIDKACVPFRQQISTHSLVL
jgi:hypothetical protein